MLMRMQEEGNIIFFTDMAAGTTNCTCRHRLTVTVKEEG